ncbi:AGR248Cp [Eremothecium gossypii ATCC 10895]|uniref:Mediator of RNA polymerase II transcription subunit 22 n=1 Tax=Eremothecium gossypii (strain ATCC 10895 / CBS 109.51 / FGSC 9923 / NRRL Y-1056) TaxID=284811 RepID=MED22_EREGS|nr:AGR248Cp [Eremothecium gossypii ATCC 10895]Q74ZF1.1 RecName: Full=Mediator of RNA polymerase II transcription subunit 22; AltName: Full=Mediator complex subunit 22 [Eremothecium gossypii ATCC 10895]AAS54738.1 AGR248Cp [Eremothecium gossypii ATCC 10895]AEY99069.1 FAGR248Cp [Eremothecium gossypii FDAG1]
MSNQVLLDKLDRTTESLSQALAQLVKLSSIDRASADSDGDNDGTTDSITSVATNGVMMVHAHTTQLIRGVQDLLVITRAIRETWVLGQIPKKNGDEDAIDYEKCERLLEKAMDDFFGPVAL